MQEKVSKVTVLLAASFLVSAACWGDDTQETRISIAIDDATHAGVLDVTVDAAGFAPHELAPGESRTMTDVDGRPVTFARGDDGRLTIEVDGQTTGLPGFPGVAGGVPPQGVDQNIHILRHHDMAAGSSPDAIRVISRKPLDASVRESIRSVLISAGHGDGVIFLDTGAPAGSPLHGEVHRIKIVSKEASTTN